MTPPGNFQMLSNATATEPDSIGWPGGVGVFNAVGDFSGGGNVSLQFQGADGSTFVAAGTSTTLNANGAGVFYLPRCQIKAVIVGTVAAMYASVGLVNP